MKQDACIGIDLVRVERLEKLFERWGERFEIRVFTEFERQLCSGRKNRAACLAMRFAAKEAFVKALGLGIRKPVLWQDVEVRQNTLGKPRRFPSPPAPSNIAGTKAYTPGTSASPTMGNMRRRL